MLLRVISMALIDGALAFDIAAFFAKLLVGFSGRKRAMLFLLLLLQDFLMKATMTWGSSWLAGFAVLKILGGLYLIWSVNHTDKQPEAKPSLRARLLQGTSASFFLNIDAAVSNGSLVRGQVLPLITALAISAVVICVFTCVFLRLKRNFSWTDQVEDLILSGTAGYLIATALHLDGLALAGVAVLVCLLCFFGRRIASLLRRKWRS